MPKGLSTLCQTSQLMKPHADDPETIMQELVAEIADLDRECTSKASLEAPESTVPREKREREGSPELKGKSGKVPRKISLRLATLLIVLAVAGTAFALTQNALPTEMLELWNTQYQSTDFSITTFDTNLQGNNKLTIGLTLTNNDVSAHYANVTVILLNATGDEILNQTQATGSVAGGGTWSYSFVFNQANIVNDYENSMVVVDQSS